MPASSLQKNQLTGTSTSNDTPSANDKNAHGNELRLCLPISRTAIRAQAAYVGFLVRRLDKRPTRRVFATETTRRLTVSAVRRGRLIRVCVNGRQRNTPTVGFGTERDSQNAVERYRAVQLLV